jgi:hypothetical protein
MLVTVSNKLPLYKNGEVAHSIELLQFQEISYEVVVAKGRFEVGDKAIYIAPDWCLPISNPLFSHYIDPSSSKLGANNRVRAIPFNFSTNPSSTQKTYSQGILLELNSVELHLSTIPNNPSLSTLLEQDSLYPALGLFKWSSDKYDDHTKGELPPGMYKTDEDNIQAVIKSLDINWEEGIELVITEKIDGESMSISYRKGGSDICSRTKSKKLDHPSDWINVGLPILNRLESYGVELVLRGEKAGPIVPNSKDKNPYKGTGIFYCYGVDKWVNGVCVRLPYSEWVDITTSLYVNTVPVLLTKTFYSYEELVDTCQSLFHKKMEGVVIRDPSSSISFKYLNPQYDSNK